MKKMAQSAENMSEFIDGVFLPTYTCLIELQEEIFNLGVIEEYLRTAEAKNKEEKYNNSFLSRKVKESIDNLKKVGRDMRQITDEALLSVVPQECESKAKDLMKNMSMKRSALQ